MVGEHLRRLVEPLDIESFLSDSYEQAPLLVRAEERTAYPDVSSLAIHDLIAQLRDPSVRVARSGLAEAAPVLKGAELAEWAHDRYGDGWTIVIDQLQNEIVEVAEIAHDIEAVFAGPCKAALFSTPGGAQGFAPHADGYDIFVIQVEGEKRWHVGHPTRRNPLPHQAGTVRKDSFIRILDVELSPGDLLFIPRGFPHDAQANDGGSVHLSVGWQPLRWADLLKSVIDQVAQRDPRLRAAAPTQLHDHRLGETEQILGTVQGAVRDPRLVRNAMELVRHDMIAMHGSAAGLEVDAAGEHVPGVDVGSAARFRVRRGIASSVLQRGTHLRMTFSGLTIASSAATRAAELRMPLRVGESVRFIAASTAPFSLDEVPGPLADAEKALLVQRLCDLGLLEVIGS